MTEHERDLQWLFFPDLQALFANRGLRAEVSLRNADGSPASEESVEELRQVLTAAARAVVVARRLSTLGELCAGVTHEARNLMTGVLGFTQIAIERSDDEALIADTLRPCEQAARSCVELLSNYLAITHAHARPAQLLSVEDVIAPATRLVGRQLEARKCTLRVTIPPPAPPVLGRRGELQQVLLNLLLNAIHVSSEGGVIEIEVSRAPNTRARIAVRDWGPGVSETLREKIFEPLFTTKPEGEGTGLGLVLSREIVEAHGGTLTLDASVSPGARFVIELPSKDTSEGGRTPR